MLTPIKNCLFLPLVVTRDLLRSKRSVAGKIGYFLLIFFFFFTTWFRGYSEAKRLVGYYLYEAGIQDKLTEIDVQGESMLPTIQDGTKVQLHSPKKYKIERGDIVSFKNNETGDLYYLKRAIGLPGEKVILKGGLISINDRFLEEEYILNNTPTFGNTFLVECNTYLVPEDHYLVLGDNRTISLDSRVIGFIGRKDIDGVIKSDLKEVFIDEQKQAEILKVSFDIDEFAREINEERRKVRGEPLRENNLLKEIAQDRVNQIKENFENWKTKIIPLDQLLGENNYQYNLAHEFITFGYLNEKDIIKQILELPTERSVFLSKNYLDLGAGVVEKTNNECTFPVILVVVAWPTAPTYSQEAINSWAEEVTLSRQTLANLQSYFGNINFDQAKLRELIEEAAQISERASQISQKVSTNEWVDSREIDQYEKLKGEIEMKLKTFLKTDKLDLEKTRQ
jgi:signal peptidase I